MSERAPFNNIVILGGGTAGWMTAASLVSLLGPAGIQVTLVESEAIGIVGVGEATLPHLKFFNQTLGIDEFDFMAKTRATIKLGIEFVDWGQKGDSYIHPFGDYGISNDGIGFHHFWRKFSNELGPICDFSFPVVAARMGKFAPPSADPSSVLSTFRYAYQFDATQYAPYLRRIAEKRGAKRIEGHVVRSHLNQAGDIHSIVLEDGQEIIGDFFVDCSGFRGLLIEEALRTGYEDWTHWLPCDRAVAAACRHEGPLLPYTRATARESGWQWRIPLQHRTGNGYVYSSNFLSEQRAYDQLVQSLEGPLLSEPKLLHFKTGKRKTIWNRNCVAIGLSGGFLEPLESTSIYLIQQGITYLIKMLQGAGRPATARYEYNRMMDLEFERIRDFLVLHYVATERQDSEFWRHMNALSLPSSLQEKMALFRAAGRVQTYDYGLFLEPSWLAVYLGQGIYPADYDPRVDQFSDSEVLTRLKGLKDHIETAAKRFPAHKDWIASHCPTAEGVPA